METHMMYEIIDRLCCVTNMLADITKMQAEVIAQMDISEKIEGKLGKMNEDVENQLDIIEYKLREIR